MGITVVLPNMMLSQLADEGPERWPGIWSTNQSRIRILLLCRRKERQLLEVHGDMIDHDHPVFSIFHRPRETADLLKEQNFNPRDASFQFLDIATTDLGKWVQHLITNDGWVRSMTEIVPVPMHLRVGMTRAFEGFTIPCFRHPDLSPLEKLHLPMPPDSLVGKAFVSIPRLGAEDLATRRGAEILVQAGKSPAKQVHEIPAPIVENVPIPLVEKQIETDFVPIPKSTEAVTSREEGIMSMSSTLANLVENQDEHVEGEDSELYDGFSEDLLASVTHSANSDESTAQTDVSDEEEKPVSLPTHAAEESADEKPIQDSESDETEIKLVFPELDSEFTGSIHSNQKVGSEKPTVPSKPPTAPPTAPPTFDESPEGEFRKVVSELLSGGVAASEIVDNAEFQKVSEVANAAGVDTWPIFLELSGAA